MDAAIENDEEEHMSVSDLAMKHLEEAADAEESTDYVNGVSCMHVAGGVLAPGLSNCHRVASRLGWHTAELPLLLVCSTLGQLSRMLLWRRPTRVARSR